MIPSDGFSSLIPLPRLREGLALPAAALERLPRPVEGLPVTGTLKDGRGIEFSYEQDRLTGIRLFDAARNMLGEYHREESGRWISSNGQVASYLDISRSYRFLSSHLFETEQYELLEAVAKDGLSFTLRHAPARYKDLDIMDHSLALAESLHLRGKTEQALSEFRRGLLLVERYAPQGAVTAMDFCLHASSFLAEHGARNSALWFQERSNSLERALFLPSQAARLDPLGRAHLLLSRLPRDLSLEVSPDRVHLSAESLHGFLEAVPVETPMFLRELFTGLRSFHLEKNQLRFEGTSRAFVLISEHLPPAEILLENLSFEVQVDPRNPERLQFKNIKGLGIRVMGVQGRIDELALRRTEQGFRLEFGKLLPPLGRDGEEERAAPRGGAGDRGRAGNAAGGVIRLPDLAGLVNRKIVENLPEIPPQELLLGAFTENAHHIFSAFLDHGKKPEPPQEQKDPLKQLLQGVFARKATAQNLFRRVFQYAAPEELRFLGEATRVTRSGEQFHLEFPDPVFVGSLGIPVFLRPEVDFSLRGDSRNPSFQDIRGMAVRPPLPPLVRSALRELGKPNVEINSLSASLPTFQQMQDGVHRILQLTCNSGHINISAQVDRDLELLTDRDEQPRFSIFGNLQGNDRETHAFCELCFGLPLRGPERRFFEGAKAIWYQEGKLHLLRKEDSSADLFGLRFFLEDSLSCRIKVRGEQVVISDIRGISAEALFPLPEFLSKLGVDTSDFLSGEPTRLEFSAPDNQGNRTVSLQTTNTVSRISVPLAADGLPRLSGEHWFVYLTIRNPASPEKSFSLTLRFHKDGHWDPEPEMLVREFARAAEQGANNPVLHGFLQFAAFGANLGIAGARVAEQAENEARDLARAGVRVAKEAANDLDALANKAVRALANW